MYFLHGGTLLIAYVNDNITILLKCFYNFKVFLAENFGSRKRSILSRSDQNISKILYHKIYIGFNVESYFKLRTSISEFFTERFFPQFKIEHHQKIISNIVEKLATQNKYRNQFGLTTITQLQFNVNDCFGIVPIGFSGIFIRGCVPIKF